jgi:nitrite reductase/ring-hydroxylating ferredoxin subunit
MSGGSMRLTCLGHARLWADGAHGMIRCLGHNIEFDLATGVCRNARCDLRVTRCLAARVTSAAVRSPHPGRSHVVRTQ